MGAVILDERALLPRSFYMSKRSLSVPSTLPPAEAVTAAPACLGLGIFMLLTLAIYLLSLMMSLSSF